MFMTKKEYRPFEENAKEFQDKLFESRIEAVNLAFKKAPKREWAKYTERMIHILFLLLGLITVGCVLLITVYLVISGIPAILRSVWWISCSAKNGHPPQPSRNTEFCLSS
jgi:ABC-type phosphate transport system permease subunit